MVNFGEPSFTSFHKEERIGSEWKHNKPKFLFQTVVGWHFSEEGVLYPDSKTA